MSQADAFNAKSTTPVGNYNVEESKQVEMRSPRS